MCSISRLLDANLFLETSKLFIMYTLIRDNRRTKSTRTKPFFGGNTRTKAINITVRLKPKIQMFTLPF